MDEILLSSVVEACVRIGRPELLTAKQQQLQSSNTKVDVNGAHTFGSLIKAYGCAKDMAGVWRTWKEMRTRRVKPTSVTLRMCKGHGWGLAHLERDADAAC